MKEKNSRLYLVALVFFISGVAGLIYEIVWERVLELYFGVTNISVVLIVSAYMAGLGFGSLFGGKISSGLKRHLAFYGFVELGIAAFGLISLNLITSVGRLTAGASYAFVFLISFFMLLIPTFLMGMTLPLLTQAFIKRVENAGEIVGLLYGINTLGAAAGSFLAGFFLIGWLGLLGTIYVACALNFLVGIAALAVDRFSGGREPAIREPISPRLETPHVRALPGYGVILGISFLVGFLGLGYEMLWIRILGIINKSTVFGFPAILGVFLTGLALGGYYFGKKADRSDDPYRLFWKLEITAACISSVTVILYWLALDVPYFQDALFSVFRNAQRPDPGYVLVSNAYVFSIRQWSSGFLSFMLPILWLVFPASFFMGAGLPVLDRIAIRKSEQAGVRVGTVHLMNILGSIAGTLIVTFGFLAWFGTEITSKILVLLGLLFMLAEPGRRFLLWGGRASIRSLSLAVIIVLTFLLPSRGQLYEKYFQAGTLDSNPVIKEYNDGVLALTSSYLWIRGVEHGSYPSDGYYESVILPCVGANHPERVLVIGLGGGNTLYFLTKVPGIKEIVLVELMEGLDEFLIHNVPRIREVFQDPRLTYIADDGRRYLYSNPAEKFDMIFADPQHHFAAGHDILYSREAQQLYRDHLAGNGIYCQWQDERHVIPHTTAQVFPEVDGFDSVIVASERAVRYDLNYMKRVADSYLQTEGDRLHADAGKHLDVSRIIRTFSRDRAAILFSERQTPIITDLDPVLEYYLFQKPVHHRIRADLETMEDFIARLDGCDEACRAMLLEKAGK